MFLGITSVPFIPVERATTASRALYVHDYREFVAATNALEIERKHRIDADSDITRAGAACPRSTEPTFGAMLVTRDTIAAPSTN